MHPKEYQKLLGDSGKPVSGSPEAPEQGAGRSPARPPPCRAPPSRYLRAPATAEYLGLSVSTLAKMRLRGDGPVFSKVGPRVVVYDIADLDAYLVARRRRSTSDIGGTA